jgi:hypothetical protein
MRKTLRAPSGEGGRLGFTCPSRRLRLLQFSSGDGPKNNPFATGGYSRYVAQAKMRKNELLIIIKAWFLANYHEVTNSKPGIT